MQEWNELIPYVKFSLIMFDVYIFSRIFCREVVRLDVVDPIKITKGF